MTKESIANEYVSKLQESMESTNLKTRQESLAWLVYNLLEILNKEVGPIGKGAAREIQSIQESYNNGTKNDLALFCFEDDEYEFMTSIYLSTVKSDEHNYCLEIYGYSPGSDTWKLYWEQDSIETILYETRNLDRSETALVAKRLAEVVVILDNVFLEPESRLHQWATFLNMTSTK